MFRSLQSPVARAASSSRTSYYRAQDAAVGTSRGHARFASSNVVDETPSTDSVKQEETWDDMEEATKLIEELSISSSPIPSPFNDVLLERPIITPDSVYLQLTQFLPRKPSETRASKISVQLYPSIFNQPLRKDILHSCVVHHLDGLRKGLAKSKSRVEVHVSARKLRPQKGSGSARLGDAGSPMLRGGGRAWPKIPRDFSTKLNRKVREMGMRVVLSAKLREQNLSITPSLAWPIPKTATLAQALQRKGWLWSPRQRRKALARSPRLKSTLFVLGGEGPFPTPLARAARNLGSLGLGLTRAADLTVYDALWWGRLVLDLKALEYFEATLAAKDVAIEQLAQEHDPIAVIDDAALASARITPEYSAERSVVFEPLVSQS